MWLSTLVITFILGGMLVHIFVEGLPVISWDFLTQPPTQGMTAGGIFPAIVGTFYVTLLTTVFSVPLGFGAAVYLSEYARQDLLTRLIRLSLRNLAGVPSIVFGLFGVALFGQIFHFGLSILSSGLTLGLLTLPVTVTASEEAMRAVPAAYREVTLALGASKWQAIHTVVIPQAMPGLLTGVILALARAAGETAPILFTGVAFFLPTLPESVFSQFMALPYHLYVLATQHSAIATVRPLAYGTALVLLGLVFLLNLTAILWRARYQRYLRS